MVKENDFRTSSTPPDVTHLTARLFIQATRQAPQTPEKVISRLPLAAGGPDVADVAVTLAEAVQGVIALATGTDETAEGVALVLAGVATVLVNLADGDLDRGVVVGLDDAVGGAALAGDVAVRKRKVSRVRLAIFNTFGSRFSPAPDGFRKPGRNSAKRTICHSRFVKAETLPQVVIYSSCALSQVAKSFSAPGPP
jgi:hypothetical protein